MPRAARKKSDKSMYHVMSCSISEIDLSQCDRDKDYYLGLLKRYIDMSISGVSKLLNEGFRLLNEHKRYCNAFNSLIQTG